MTRKKSPKESTTKELALGGGMMLVFLPVIFFALVGISWLFASTIFLSETTLFSIIFSLVSGTLMLLIVVYLWKFWARFRLLTGRWIGLRREKQRLAESFDPARLALDMTAANDVPLGDDFDSIIIADRSES